MARTSVHQIAATRQEQKQRTREALLDAAASLLENQNLSSLGLREVTRAVGIAPAAFYRHFRDMDELGQGSSDPDESVQSTLDVLATYVGSHQGPFRIIARERSGGVAPVRRAIGDRLRQATEELADDLARLPGYEDWRRDDITMIAGMFVNHVVQLASALLDVPADQPEEARRLLSLARRQLHLIVVGRRHWLDEPLPE